MEIWQKFAFADEASPMIDGQIDAMKRNRLSGLEIRNVDEVNVSDITLEKAQEVKKKMDDNGLTIWSVGSPIGKIDIEKDSFEEHLDKLKRTLEITSVLGTKNIRVFSFYLPERKNPADYKNEVIDRLGRFCEAAADSGICLCHENEKGIYGDVPERCYEIFTSLPEMKGIFDPANFVQCGVDTMKAWELLHSYVKYLHIKDACLDGTIVPAGQGAGNVASIMKLFYKQGGNVFTLEPHLTEFKGLSDLERKGKESNIRENAYPDNDTAFDAACRALETIITKERTSL